MAEDKIRGGLAEQADVSFITTKSPLCRHVFSNWSIYTEVVDKWQPIIMINSREHTRPKDIVGIVADFIRLEDPETRIEELSVLQGVDVESFCRKIALVCMTGAGPSRYDFPKIFKDRCGL